MEALYITPIPTVTPTATSQPLEIRCPDYASANETIETGLSGNLIVGSSETGFTRKYYLLDIGTNETKELPGEILSSFFVSPNHRWVVFDASLPGHTPKSNIIVLSYDQGKQFTYPLVETGYVGGWINDDWIWAWHAKINGRFIFGLRLLNPFTGEIREMPMDYPRIVLNHFDFRYWEAVTIYDPTLRWVIYVRQTNDLILWDREASEDIMTVRYFGYPILPPVWSPDGSHFVYLSKEFSDLVIVDTNGMQVQVTDFSLIEPEEPFIHAYVWSPDSRHIVMWLNNDLAVSDVNSHGLIKYCFQVGRNQHYKPVWSPDSRYVAIPNFDDDQERT